MTASGRFISFEGIDGAGKSTQLLRLAEHLRARGLDVLVTREPGGTPVGESLRSLVLGSHMQPLTETLVMFAARAEHVATLIRPALDAGRWVLCDRFTDATYAYQVGGRRQPAELVAELARWAHPGLWPDKTFLVDVPLEVALQRLSGARDADRFESEQRDFTARVREFYLDLARAEPGRFVVLDGRAAPEVVHAEILRAIEPWLQR